MKKGLLNMDRHVLLRGLSRTTLKEMGGRCFQELQSTSCQELAWQQLLQPHCSFQNRNQNRANSQSALSYCGPLRGWRMNRQRGKKEKMEIQKGILNKKKKRRRF